MLKPWVVELFRLFAEPHERALGRYASAPTAGSILRIQDELQISLPADFIELASLVPSLYGTWFAGIGEDEASPFHIIGINRDFRAPNQEGWIPPWLVLLNHGHDGDCDGFDSRVRDAATGEHPIYFWPDYQGRDYRPKPPFPSFTAYLEDLVLAQAQSVYDNRNRSGRLRSGARELARKIDEILGRS